MWTFPTMGILTPCYKYKYICLGCYLFSCSPAGVFNSHGMRTASFLSDLWVVLRAMTVLSEGSLVGDLECAGVEREERERKKGRQAWDINRPRENKRRFHMV